MDSMHGWQPTKQGTPQGAVISPVLANLYLNGLDHLMVQSGREMVRYADDFVVCARTEEEAKEALVQIAAWVKEAGLTLHPAKTRIVNAAQKGGVRLSGIPFRAIWKRWWQEMAPAKEPVQAARKSAGQAGTLTPRQRADDSLRGKPDVARLVQLLQVEPADRNAKGG